VARLVRRTRRRTSSSRSETNEPDAQFNSAWRSDDLSALLARIDAVIAATSF
jgi:hypothetical protein